MRSRTLVAGLLGALIVVSPATPAHAAGAPGGAAPGGPGLAESFLPADKAGVATSTGTASTVWLTVQREGGLGEIYYPDLGTPSARALQFVVADRHGHAVRAQDAARVDTVLADPASLTYRQEFRERAGRWLLTVTYVTDPARATVLVDVRFAGHGGYDVYTIYDPALGNTRIRAAIRVGVGVLLPRADVGRCDDPVDVVEMWHVAGEIEELGDAN